MTRPFRFALQVGGVLHDHDALVAAATQASELGYAQLWSSDHLGHVDPFVPLVAAGLAAPALEVGPLVLNNEFHQPVLLARTAATVDRLLGGRLVLGLGTGYAQSEHDAAGIELRPPGPRVRRFGESLEVLRALLDTGSCSFDGEFHHVELEALGVTPGRQPVPILVGGHGRRVVGLAARFADIYQFTGLVHAPDGTPTAAGIAIEHVRLRAQWIDESPRSDAIERSSLVQALHVGDGADAARTEIATQFEVDASIIDHTPFALVGSLEQVVDELERRRVELGISHYVVRDAEQFAPVVAALAGR